MISVSCRRNVLDEVRICLTKDLRGFRTCEEVDRAAAGRGRSACRRCAERPPAGQPKKSEVTCSTTPQTDCTA